MPKRINLTLSDEAVERLQAVPFHNRGAYVSSLLLAAGNYSDPTRPRCKCGLELSSRVLADHGVWAATKEDIAAYKAHQAPAHDVIAGTGKRLRIGACSARARGE